jgi:hypothetical protein
MRALTTFDWILRIAGSVALVLGLLIWTFQLDVVSIHTLFGLVVAIALLVISMLSALTRPLRALGITGIVYSFILPLLGLNQETLLVGNLHWIIQIIHLLVGIGALALGGVMSTLYRRLQLKQTPSTSESVEARPS